MTIYRRGRLWVFYCTRCDKDWTLHRRCFAKTLQHAHLVRHHEDAERLRAMLRRTDLSALPR